MEHPALQSHPISEALQRANYGNYPDLSKVNRCLIIKLAHIGDVLLTTPVFSCLHSYFSDRSIEVHAMVYEDTESILRYNKFINHIHAIKRKKKDSKSSIGHMKDDISLLRSLRKHEYDLVLNMTSGDRGAISGFISGAKLRVSLDPRGKGMLGKKRLSTHFVSYPLRPRHAIERNLDFLRLIGIHPKPSNRGLHLDPGDEARNSLFNKIRSFGVDLSYDSPIIISPTTRWRFKSWGTDSFAKLADHLTKFNVPIILVGGKEALDLDIANEIVVKSKTNPLYFTGETSLLELAALLEKSSLFIGVDSAPMHMAAALRVPTIGIFGPTNIAEWAPWDNGSGHCRAIAMHELSCLPCDRAGCANSKVSDCLVRLPVDSVLNAATELLKQVKSE